MRKPELIAPAGNWDCVRAAVANGADAVYFGLQQFNARVRAGNFTGRDLPALVAFLHEHRVRAYGVLNVLVFTDELPAVERELRLLDEAGVDAVMVQDLGLAVLARELGLRLEIHASTQMTITSPQGVEFARQLGITRVVLARETTLREMQRFAAAAPAVELEVFVHGALCVAYSGQCLTSEALGQRSANRGECAQACRLPYQLVVDGAVQDLGDRRYLLSPQDLAAVRQIPELLRLGVAGFKIEGRLKTPEYVAATCQVYRKALDAAVSCAGENVTHTVKSPAAAAQRESVDAGDWYKLEMTFSRGLCRGWLPGVNHQELVHARFGKKRGPFAGQIQAVGRDHVQVEPRCRLRAGDGVVFDTGGDPDHEQGGRIWEIRGRRLFFQRGHIEFSRLKPGDRVWKTSDPQLERALRQTFARGIPRPKRRLDLVVSGAVDKPLTVACGPTQAVSSMLLQTACQRPLTEKLLREQLGRLGQTGYELGELDNRLVGQVILPVSELNRLRRKLVAALGGGSGVLDGAANHAAARHGRRAWEQLRLAARNHPDAGPLQLVVLCRSMDQIGAALETGCEAIHVDFDDLRRGADAVALVRRGVSTGIRTTAGQRRPLVFLATPRIQKAGEHRFLKMITAARPDGVLIRHLGALDYFRNSSLRRVGDFSLNVANPLTADWLIRAGLERVTVSYDCNARQVIDLLRAAPPEWFELVIHQHLPMFHMEYCVFAAYLSTGTDRTTCGRPCDRHDLKLRDRVGAEHPVKADVGCRNTVYHARAQSGAMFLREFLAAGARAIRVELLGEDAAQTRVVVGAYRQLLANQLSDPLDLVRRLRAVDQLGVTGGTLTVLD